MTIKMATAAAIPAMIATNLSNSRCKVVKRLVSMDESLAMVPLQENEYRFLAVA